MLILFIVFALLFVSLSLLLQFNFMARRKYAMTGSTLKIESALMSSIIFANGLIQFNAEENALLSLNRAHIAKNATKMAIDQNAFSQFGTRNDANIGLVG